MAAMQNNTDSLHLMTKEDQEFFQFLSDLRFHINKFIDINEIIEKIKELINQSENFSFSSKQAGKYINKERPIFSIVYTTNRTFNSYNEKFNYLKKLLDMDIISPFSEYINKSIRENQTNIFSKEDRDRFLNNSSALNFIFTSIFGINFSKSNNVIYLQYMK